MSKLRVVKERQERSDNFEQDLRGLGGTDLLANEYPWVFLTIKGHPSNLEQTCKVLGLAHKEGQNSGEIHVFKPGKSENHKEKTLSLFGAAVLLLSTTPTLPMCIGQISVLAQKIQGVELRDIKEESSEDYQLWSKTAGLATPDAIRLYLHHAGIDLSHQLVSASELTNIVQSQATHAKTNHKISKVG